MTHVETNHDVFLRYRYDVAFQSLALDGQDWPLVTFDGGEQLKFGIVAVRSQDVALDIARCQSDDQHATTWIIGSAGRLPSDRNYGVIQNDFSLETERMGLRVVLLHHQDGAF